jgi:hypothetical protein
VSTSSIHPVITSTPNLNLRLTILFITQGGGTALFMSAHNDHLEVARLLLESKADINAELEDVSSNSLSPI